MPLYDRRFEPRAWRSISSTRSATIVRFSDEVDLRHFQITGAGQGWLTQEWGRLVGLSRVPSGGRTAPIGGKNKAPPCDGPHGRAACIEALAPIMGDTAHRTPFILAARSGVSKELDGDDRPGSGRKWKHAYSNKKLILPI